MTGYTMTKPGRGIPAIALNLPPDGGLVVAAVSGGADSMTMLHLLCAAREDGRVSGIVCAHFNHRLRETAGRDEAHVRRVCAEWDVPFVTESADVAAIAAQTGQSAEMAARDARYAFLRRVAGETGAMWILSAHNAGDNAETVLLNLLRGTGLAGLCGIPYTRGQILRPLLHVSRDEIMAYVRTHQIPFVEDESNAETAYRRNLLRHEVMPVLRQINPSLDRAVTRMCEHLRQDEDFLSALAQSELARYARREGDAVAYPAKNLLETPAPVAFRILRGLAEMIAARGLEAPHMRALLSLCQKGQHGKRTGLPGAYTARRDRKYIILQKEVR